MEPSTVLRVLVGLFVVVELGNVLTLYFAPGSDKGNGVGVFLGWSASQRDPELGAFVRYLVNWVAGAKIIFVALWLVILILGDARVQLWASAVMIPAIATFYWRLFPIIRELDARDRIRPRGYSKVLGWMIAGILAAFVAAVAVAALG